MALLRQGGHCAFQANSLQERRKWFSAGEFLAVASVSVDKVDLASSNYFATSSKEATTIPIQSSQLR